MGATIGVTLFGLIVVSLHSFALYVLRVTTMSQPNHKMYLLHISSLEIIITILSLVTLYVDMFLDDVKVQEYCYYAMVSVTFPWMYILTMFTADRFLQVYLNVKYSAYVTKRKRQSYLS